MSPKKKKEKEKEKKKGRGRKKKNWHKNKKLFYLSRLLKQNQPLIKFMKPSQDLHHMIIKQIVPLAQSAFSPTTSFRRFRALVGRKEESTLVFLQKLEKVNEFLLHANQSLLFDVHAC